MVYTLGVNVDRYCIVQRPLVGASILCLEHYVDPRYQYLDLFARKVSFVSLIDQGSARSLDKDQKKHRQIGKKQYQLDCKERIGWTLWTLLGKRTSV